MPAPSCFQKLFPAIGQLRKGAILPHAVQMEPPARLPLRKERNSAAQQHGSDLHNQAVHQVRVQKGSQDRVSSHNPDVFPPADLLNKLRSISADKMEPFL